MKRFVAICLLVVCVALPLLVWAGTYECPKCGAHRTCAKEITLPANWYDSQYHYYTHYTKISCTICKNVWTDLETHIPEAHMLKKTVIDRIPNLNLKQVKYTCKPCGYSYTEYEPIDPSKPYGAIHN